MALHKINTLIVIDKPECKAVLEIMLRKLGKHVDIIGICSSAEEAIEQIQLLKPDLILLDIDLTDKNGFAVLEAFGNSMFKAIIFSSNDHYAIKAIKFDVIDYILKPLDISELKNALEKAIRNLEYKIDRERGAYAINKGNEKNVDRIIIPTTRGFYSISLDNVESIEAQSGSYCFFKLIDKSRDIVTKPLSYFERIVPQNQFFRIHRSFMVNLKRVESFDRKEGKVKMKNGDEFEVAIRRRRNFIKNMRDFQSSQFYC